MKVTPSNQTLILANEGPAGTPAQSALRSAMQSVPGADSGGDSVLQRVTIVTAHPDSTMVYMQADYAAAGRSFADISPDSIVATIPAAAPATYGPRLSPSSAASAGAPAPVSSTSVAAIAGTDMAANGSASGGALVASYSRSPSTGFANRSSRAVDLYASTQNILSVSQGANHIDVLA